MEIGREGGLDSRADGPKEAKVQRGERASERAGDIKV